VQSEDSRWLTHPAGPAGWLSAPPAPRSKIALVALRAASHADDSDALGGVAPWLPCLYFAAGAVAARLWQAIARPGDRDQRNVHRDERYV